MEGWAKWSRKWGWRGGLRMGDRRPRGVFVHLSECHGAGASGGCVGSLGTGDAPPETFPRVCIPLPSLGASLALVTQPVQTERE